MLHNFTFTYQKTQPPDMRVCHFCPDFGTLGIAIFVDSFAKLIAMDRERQTVP
jgi:hypothetical protein